MHLLPSPHLIVTSSIKNSSYFFLDSYGNTKKIGFVLMSVCALFFIHLIVGPLI